MACDYRSVGTSTTKQTKGAGVTEAPARQPGPVRSIRLLCLECSSGSSKAVSECPTVKCPVWRFRLGRQGARRSTPELRERRRKLAAAARARKVAPRAVVEWGLSAQPDIL